MIPKTIHYCWFGGKPLPKSARKCIDSWRKFLPDYEIREWNESNFDVRMIPYTAEAYAAKKYAFVSDYARFWVLYEHGGIYFDTDVEVIRPMDDILAKGAFLGIEEKIRPQQNWTVVNPGLGLACPPRHALWMGVLQTYQKYSHFIPGVTICTIVTDYLKSCGIAVTPEGGIFDELTIYSAEYFCPQAMQGAPLCITSNTRSIHHYDASWMPFHTKLKMKLMSMLPYNVRIWLSNLRHSLPGNHQ